MSDELNHASIIDGIRLCKSKKYRYKHKDMNDLERMLAESQECRSRLIVTDGVFSMDGNVCPLPEIKKLADKYNALIFIDECHATGFFGATGRGTEEFYGMEGSVDIINSTLGKALGGAAGGYTTGSRDLISLLRQRSRPYSFSNSLPPPVVGTASKVFDILMTDSSLVKKITENTQRFGHTIFVAKVNLKNLMKKDYYFCNILVSLIFHFEVSTIHDCGWVHAGRRGPPHQPRDVDGREPEPAVRQDDAGGGDLRDRPQLPRGGAGQGQDTCPDQCRPHHGGYRQNCPGLH